jgi:hypothetical protein
MYLVFRCYEDNELCFRFGLEIVCSSVATSEKYIDDYFRSVPNDKKPFRAHPSMTEENNYTFIGDRAQVFETRNDIEGRISSDMLRGFVIEEVIADEPLDTFW